MDGWQEIELGRNRMPRRSGRTNERGLARHAISPCRCTKDCPRGVKGDA